MAPRPDDQLMGIREDDGRATAKPHGRQGELLSIGSLVRTMLPDWRVDAFGLHVGCTGAFGLHVQSKRV